MDHNGRHWRFQVALSYPGVERERVARVADVLIARLGQRSVLFDPWYRGEFARPNLVFV